MKNFTMGPAILFCPADRSDRYAKALERADAVILDLEDAVAAENRAGARRMLIDNPLDPERTIVRINPVGTLDFAADVAAVQRTAYRTIMLAKTETLGDLATVADFNVVALCETALGIINAPQIAAARHVVGLMWGAEDLVASLGGSSSRQESGTYRDVARHARSQVLLAAGAFGKVAIDSVYINIPDHQGLLAESIDAQASGFGAKASIHPGQMAVIRKAFMPTPEQVDRAARLLAAAEDANGVFTFEGQMVDEPILRHARAILDRRAIPDDGQDQDSDRTSEDRPKGSPVHLN
ncbi:citrate (pro-3S)-lyase subunit beta [Paeniglutamicibacter psychrophenolicus]|uniref:Citrate lyase subunit beta/citryl-CoA lyase n=1 Tax=Paeniglutamicibacter psychrophenolicus TaxID=257454 RepID=A0ABS4WJQ1_9MICC|nr:CoA ester lyase [Paeniglutamicibacter psychrophenolicus]MBP2376430.1 citrate lyase subunit beta/citryl-CoA lyase [Paeniglutamicibacter psychrophenolicus]